MTTPVQTSAMEALCKACAFRNSQNLIRVEKCLDMLAQNDIWSRPNENMNSVGNLILHLNGNITQYILSALGGAADERRRDTEFAAGYDLTAKELIDHHRSIVEKAGNIILHLDYKLLNSVFRVQGFEYTGTGILIHVTEHYSYHTGQIALLVKLMKNKDLGFYKGVDLNKRN